MSSAVPPHELHPSAPPRGDGEAQRAAELLELGDALLELDREWRVVRVNRNQERLSRRPRSETLGRVLWELWPEVADPASRYWREYHRCMRERVPVQFQELFAPLALWTDVTAYPTSTGGIAVFFRDVSAQKRAEQALRDSEDLLRLAKDAARMGAWSWDAATGALTWSARCKALFGFPPDATVTWDAFMAAIHPDDRARVTAAAQRAREDGGEYESEMRVPLPDGAVRWIASKGRAYQDDQGRTVRLTGMSLDITERKRAEEALRASEERLREQAELVESAPVLVRNVRDEIVVWNAGMERLYGYRREEAMGAVSHALLHTRFPRPIDEIRSVLAREGRWEGELVHRCRDGGDITVASLWILHRDPAGQPSAIIEVNNDITARRQAEEALREADRRKNEFLAVLSHELRNPLAPIRNGVQVLEHAPGDSPQAARAREVIRRQTDHLTRLVDDLLDITRISRGKVRLRRAVLDVRELLQRTCEDHRALFERGELQLRVELPPTAVLVDADATRLAQIVGNLLQNARKFTPAGGAVVVSLQAGAGQAAVHVRDTGIGMEPEHVARLFEPFAQEERGLARSGGGLGLGLALAKGLVELHGGALTARSAGAGRGSEFVLALPLAAGASLGEVAAAPAARPERLARRVLLIEDNADAARTLADLLELDGHEVRIAPDGASGLALARELRPDVILCDLGLPDLEGFDVARALRSDPALRGARLVALSGYTQPEDRERAREAGFDVHLAKPAPPEAIAAALG